MKAQEAIKIIEKQSLKKEIPDFQVGDQVKVSQRVVEGDKTRHQIFEGIVIRRKGSGTRETFTVFREVRGDMIEKVFPLHSPTVEKVVVTKPAKKVRRSRLYHLWRKKEIV